jgi:hypothetical protein
MFSTNQAFQISGEFDQLVRAIRFALAHSEYSKSKLMWQTTTDRRYCIGFKPFDGVPDGWTEYESKYDVVKIARDVVKFLNEQPPQEIEYEYGEARQSNGFLMGVISPFDARIKNPFYGIVAIGQFSNFYAK